MPFSTPKKLSRKGLQRAAEEVRRLSPDVACFQVPCHVAPDVALGRQFRQMKTEAEFLANGHL